MSVFASQRSTVLTLSSSNLLALEQIEAEFLESKPLKNGVISDISTGDTHIIEVAQRELLKKIIMTDFWNNLTIVTIPGCLAYSVWRLMNLFGIAVSHNFYQTIVETTWYIATVVFLLFFMIDALRQLYLYDAFKSYYNNNGILSSFHLAFKFFFAVIFWTVGYEILANDHQIYSDKSKTDEIIFRSLGAGMGAFIGLIIAAQLISIIEYNLFMTKNRGYWYDTNQRGILGVAMKGFCQGLILSILGDLEIYKIFGNNTASVILDSLIVGIASSLWFAFGGVYTSLLGYCQQHSLFGYNPKSKIKNNNQEYTPLL
eukprot:299559_1